MNNHFFSIYQRSVVLANGKHEEHYVLCYGNYCVCESSDEERVRKAFHNFIDKTLVL